jgi:DHA2 family multidrug resistance protein
MLQGFGFASLFVPLTTVALAGIPRYRLTDATGLNSLLRQIGGSLGLAAFATLLPRFVGQARTGLAAHAAASSPELAARLGALQSGLTARGLDATAAHAGALRILDGMLAQQSSVLAFERMFLFAGIAFLFVIPLALLLRKPPGPGKTAELH